MASSTGLEKLAALFEALRRERPTVAYDLPVRTANAALGREDYVRAVEDVLTEVRARYDEPADVVAVGLTCELVAAAARRGPELVRSLVMVAPEGFDAPVLPRWLEKAARRVVRRALRAPAIGVVLHRAWSSEGGGGGGGSRARAIAGATCRAERDGEAEDLYEALVVPTMFVHGRISLEADRRVREIARRSRLFQARIIEGARGRPHVDAPRACAEAVLAFHRSLAMRPKLRLLRGGRVGAPTTPRAHLHVATLQHG